MIRPLDPVADLAFVTETENQIFKGHLTEDHHRKQFEVPGCEGLILEACGQRAAFLIHQPVEEGIYIRTLAVLPRFRRRGYGRQLLRQMIATGASLTLHVHDKNRVARNLYRSLGFMEIRREKEFYGVGDTDVAILLLRPF